MESTPGRVSKITRPPSLDSPPVTRPLPHTPFYWAFDASAAGLSRSEPQQGTCPGSIQVCIPAFRTGNLLERFDLNPQISLPLLFQGWSVRPELTVRETYYTERLVGQKPGQAATDPMR